MRSGSHSKPENIFDEHFQCFIQTVKSLKEYQRNEGHWKKCQPTLPPTLYNLCLICANWISFRPSCTVFDRKSRLQSTRKERAETTDLTNTVDHVAEEKATTAYEKLHPYRFRAHIAPQQPHLIVLPLTHGPQPNSSTTNSTFQSFLTSPNSPATICKALKPSWAIRVGPSKNYSHSWAPLPWHPNPNKTNPQKLHHKLWIFF